MAELDLEKKEIEAESGMAMIVERNGRFLAFFWFILAGLGFSVFIRLLLAPRDFFQSAGLILLLSFVLEAGIFCLDFFLYGKLPVFWRLAAIYFFSGFSGLFLIEFLIFENTEIMGWPYLFSLWAGMAAVPGIIFAENKREIFWAGFSAWLAVIAGLFICAGGFLYFVMPDYGRMLWLLAMMGMTVAFNLVWWREFWQLRRPMFNRLPDRQQEEDGGEDQN